MADSPSSDKLHSQTVNSPHSTGHEYRLPCSHHHAPFPILKQTTSIDTLNFYSFTIHFNIILPSTPMKYTWCPISPSQLCKCFTSPPCMPHAVPISSSLIQSP